MASNTNGVFDENYNSSSEIDLAALSTIGGMGGGQIGWNFQSGSMVFGVEADISFVDLDESRIEAQELTDLSPGGDTTDVSFESDFLATVRGRIGWASDNVLLYATGGVAFLEGEVSTTADTSDDSCPDDPGNYTCSEDFSEVGGIVGAGLEWGAPRRTSASRSRGFTSSSMTSFRLTISSMALTAISSRSKTC
ncbi:MAG: outer membrane beta-barrel protein [Pseudomonadota bacterium]|nr:outer membrane beta-barrel protein [Pseudomonadota bacterium]